MGSGPGTSHRLRPPASSPRAKPDRLVSPLTALLIARRALRTLEVFSDRGLDRERQRFLPVTEPATWPDPDTGVLVTGPGGRAGWFACCRKDGVGTWHPRLGAGSPPHDPKSPCPISPSSLTEVLAVLSRVADPKAGGARPGTGEQHPCLGSLFSQEQHVLGEEPAAACAPRHTHTGPCPCSPRGWMAGGGCGAGVRAPARRFGDRALGPTAGHGPLSAPRARPKHRFLCLLSSLWPTGDPLPSRGAGNPELEGGSQRGARRPGRHAGAWRGRKEAFPGLPCTLWKLCFCVAFVFLFFSDVLRFPWGACAQQGRGVELGAGRPLFRKARTGWTPLPRRRPAVTPCGPGRVRGAGGPQAGLTEKACFLVPFLPHLR